MNAFQIAMLSIGGVLFVGIILCIIFKRDFLHYGRFFSPVINVLSKLISGISGILPDSCLLKTIAEVLKAAIRATTLAEDAWKMGIIDKESRNEIAKGYVYEVLTDAGIEITEAVEMIVDGAIAIVCMLLPHEVIEDEDE